METEISVLPHDPVCGMSVEPAEATARGLVADHNGVTYYFCCAGCDTKFAAEPKKYLKPGT